MPEERAEKSPFLSLRIARIIAVYFDKGAPGLLSETNRSEDFTLGRAKVEWLDWEGQRDFVQLSFPSISASSANKGDDETRVIIPYGDLSMPSVDDVVVLGFRDPSNAVVLSYLPNNYRRLTDANETTQGTLRRIIPGEFSRKSRQQAEIYQDKAGATQIIVRAQPVFGSVLTDGSATTKASGINQAAVPQTELVRVTIGESYTNENFTTRETTVAGKKVILRVKAASGTKINIDTDGNIEVVGAGTVKMTGTEINFNSGEKGIARLDDEVKSTPSEDSAYWQFLTQLIAIFNAHVHITTGTVTSGAGAGGATLGAAQATLTPAPTAPQSLTGKITASSSTVKAGD